MYVGLFDIKYLLISFTFGKISQGGWGKFYIFFPWIFPLILTQLLFPKVLAKQQDNTDVSVTATGACGLDYSPTPLKVKEFLLLFTHLITLGKDVTFPLITKF